MNYKLYRDYMVGNTETEKEKFERRHLRRMLKEDYDRLFKQDRRALYKKHSVPRVKRWQVLKIP